MIEPRPAHVTLAGNTITHTAIGDEEWAGIQARGNAYLEAAQAAETARQADLETLAARAAQDPAIAALVRLLGLQLPEGDPK